MDKIRLEGILITNIGHLTTKIGHVREIKAEFWTSLSDLKRQLTAEQIQELAKPVEEKRLGDICLKCNKEKIMCRCAKAEPEEIKELDYSELVICDYGDTDRIIEHILVLARKQNEVIQAVNTLRNLIKRGE